MKRVIVLLSSVLASACGGKVIVDATADGSGGAGGSGLTTTATTGPGSSTASGPGGCTTHQDCGPDELCVFTSGTCAKACEAGKCVDCGPGLVCDGCATSACPDCLDCRAACVPPKPGQCDDTDGCPAGQACDHANNTCAPTCSSNPCSDPDTTCAVCATGSCCGCEDCVSLCLPL